jgi:hypothetical protein
MIANQGGNEASNKNFTEFVASLMGFQTNNRERGTFTIAEYSLPPRIMIRQIPTKRLSPFPLPFSLLHRLSFSLQFVRLCLLGAGFAVFGV